MFLRLTTTPHPYMAPLAEGNQIRELVFVAAFGKRNDVMNLEPIG